MECKEGGIFRNLIVRNMNKEALKIDAVRKARSDEVMRNFHGFYTWLGSAFG